MHVCMHTHKVASQLNCLEFVGPRITPEHGVTGYVNDRTQGRRDRIVIHTG